MYTKCEICVAVFDRFYSFLTCCVKMYQKLYLYYIIARFFQGSFLDIFMEKGLLDKTQQFFYSCVGIQSKEHGKFMKLYKSRVTPIKEKRGTLSLLTFPIQLNSRVLIYKGPLFSHHSLDIITLSLFHFFLSFFLIYGIQITFSL